MASTSPSLVALVFALFVSAVGCATSPRDNRPNSSATSFSGPEHSTNAVPSVPPDPADAVPEIKPGQKWNPVWWFGNIDDPVPPPNYRPDDKHRVGKWYGRNRLHNFTFYVIGFADKKFERIGRFEDEVFNPDGGWNWAVCKYKWLRLPFISYENDRVRFYVGWRNRANFGVKLAFSSANNDAAKPVSNRGATGQQVPWRKAVEFKAGAKPW